MRAQCAPAPTEEPEAESPVAAPFQPPLPEQAWCSPRRQHRRTPCAPTGTIRGPWPPPTLFEKLITAFCRPKVGCASITMCLTARRRQTNPIKIRSPRVINTCVKHGMIFLYPIRPEHLARPLDPTQVFDSAGHHTYFDAAFGFWGPRGRLRVASGLPRKAWLPGGRPVRPWRQRRDWRWSASGCRGIFAGFPILARSATTVAGRSWVPAMRAAVLLRQQAAGFPAR